MAALTSEEDLNSYFQSTSDFSQEEADWNLNFKFLISKIKSLSQITSLETASSPAVEFEVFGSASEDLKFCLPNDIGDIDIMVYPVSEEVLIDDSLIEIADGVAPVFARLRGTNHPVLRHCLVENSEFVSTSALKEFHPKIFGQKTHFLNLIPRIFSIADEFDLDNIASEVVDNPAGPSLQLQVKHTFGSVTEQAQDLSRVFRDITKNDSFRNVLEWFAVTLNPQRTFTDEHSACIDDFLEVVQEKSEAFAENSSVANYFSMLNQILVGDHNLLLKQKVQEIDKRVQVSEENSQYHSATTTSSANTTDSSTSSFPNAASSRASLPNAAGANLIDGTSPNYSTVDSAVDNHNIGGYKAGAAERKEKANAGTKMSSQIVPENETTASEDDGIEQITFSDLQDLLRQRLLDGIFTKSSSTTRTNSPVEKHPAIMEHQNEKIQSGIDLVPALKGRGWPKVARAWPTRARLWPSQDTITKVLESGFHVVVKSPHSTNHPDQFFRLSFSRAELVLSGELNNVQRECHRCLKRYYHYVIDGRKVKIITSYFLKTALLWTIEETGPEFWSEENRATCVLMLLERLYKYLKSKFLPLYFIPEVNLLENAIIDHPEEVEYIANQFRKIYENPRIFPIVDKDRHSQSRSTKGNFTILKEGVHSDTKNNSQENTSITDAISPPCAKEVLQGNANAEKAHISQSFHECEVENGAASVVVPQGTGGTIFFLKYREFQTIYNEVYKELIDLVLQAKGSHQKDPVTQVTIENLQVVASKMQNPEAEMTALLEQYSNSIYSLHVLHPGSTTKQRILSALKGYSEIFSFIIAQDDLLAEGNEHLILARMIDSIDMTNALMPNCFGAFKEMVQTLEPRILISLGPCEDEILLD